MTLARDLGSGPHRPFGSALKSNHGEPIHLIGRTRRLMSEPPCSVCGNHSAWRCDCDEISNTTRDTGTAQEAPVTNNG